MKKLFTILAAMLISMVGFAQTPVYELVPASGSNNSYAGNCDVTVNGIKWNLTGNSTMDPWRIGGKSITKVDRALYSKTPLAYNIDKIEVTHGTANSITVNSFKLIISDEANGAGETIDVAFKASATTTIDLPEGDYSNKYFKFLYNVTVSGSSNKYVQFKGAKFYAALAEDAVKAPIITGAEDFISETEVTIEAEDDVTVYYTLDGTEPTTASTVYAAPFTVKETTTVKAIAYRGETASFVTSATFTQATRVTAAEAAELAMKVASNNALTSVTYVINAYVTSVIDQTLSSGQQRFWVADTKDGGQVLQSYYCNVPQVLKVGDYIQMFGKLTKYNTSPQMKNGDVTILEEPAPEPVMFTVTATAENGTVEGAGEYAENAEATLTATAAEGYEFVNWTVDGAEVSTENPYTFVVTANVALVANFKAVVVEEPLPEGVPTNAELWEAFKPYYNTYYGLTRADQPIDKVSTFAAAKMQEIMTDAASEYKWLGDYVLGVAAGQGVNLPTDMAAANEGAWRWAVHAFFNATTGANGAAGTDFTEAGKPQAWGPYYLAAQTPVEPEPTTETVYFINAKKWAKVNVYAWTTDPNASWPGAAATKEAEQIAGYDVYSFTANAGQYANVIFNDGSSQTPDLVWTAGKYYVVDMGWLTKEEAEAKLATPLPETWNVVGDAGLMGKGWDLNAAENAMTKQADGTYKLEKKGITITAGTYEYKAAKDHSWTVAVPQDGNQKLTISKSGIYDITFVLDVTAKKLTATATLKQEEVIIPTIQVAGDMTSWGDAPVTLVMAADSLTATATIKLDAKTYEFKMIVGGNWQSDAKTVNRDNNSTVFTGANSDTNTKLVADQAGDYIFTWTYATKTLTVTYPTPVTKYTVTLSDNTGGFEPLTSGAGEYEEGDEVTVSAVDSEGWVFVGWMDENGDIVSNDYQYTFVIEGNVALVAIYAQLMALEVNDLEIITEPVVGLTGTAELMPGTTLSFELIVDDSEQGEDGEFYLTEDSKVYLNDETELEFLEGIALIDLMSNTAQAQVLAAMGETLYLFNLDMSAAAELVELVLTDAIVAINEELGTLTFNVPTGEGEGYFVELAGYTAPGVHEGPQICLFETPEVVAYTNYAETSVADGVITLKGEFVSPMGPKFDLTISGKLPEVEEPEVEKPEPTYTENNLNPYAFGLESKLSDDKTTLTVTYRLNNSNATSVNVVIYNGEDIVASIPGTTTIGKNTVEVATGNLPAGVELKWAVEVNGTSVEAPTQETKMYNMYCPHGLAIDKDPESEYFGRILVADAMNVVKDKAGYLGSGIGAGLHAFNPSFTTDSTVYTGGNDFTRILASNGYQPWRVKISEDGRIFVSSLDLNGVVVWEVSKDLQTWTPVIAGTNDATDHNIYDADGNFVAGLNCSMDVIGSGEDLKLLLYSTNNKGIAFNQSGYRLDEYALGTATTWTGTPKNILEGGKFGVVHTNVEFIYDGEGGYWFGASRAGNAGQPNLVHINAAGEQDYYTEDAGLYGGDGVLVHNGMLFKGKARTSGTVGNFGVWTIGKDADGKVTLTEKWSVVADGIGRNLNEFAVDYAENLYVVGNSGEKIIAYALPYSGQVVTPAASKYAFHIGELLPDPAVVTEMVGVVKRAVQNGESTIVLTHETDGTAHIYEITNGTILELLQNGVVPVDPENKGSYLAISDIAVTEDGKLVANNYVRNQFAGTAPEAGYLVGTSYYYIWNDLHDAPSVWFTSQTTARSSHGDVGVTFALKGTSTNAELLVTAVHNNNRAVRLAKYNIIDGQYVEPNIPGGQQSSEYYEYFGTHTKEAYYQEAVQGKQFQLNVSPLGDNNWIMDGELVDPSEFVLPGVGENYAASATLTEDLGKKFNGASYVTVGEKVLMVAPYATPEGKLTGVEILDITGGLDAAQYVDQLFIDEAVEATAAATAVEVVEGDEATALLITLVADATIYSLEATLSNGPDVQIYEDEITNLVIDLDNLVLIGGPSSAFQVDVYLPLGEYNMSEDSYQLTAESSIAVMGSDATFIEGYAYEVDAFTPSAKAVVRCEWNGMLLEFHLTMTAAPLEATVVVVENALVEIEKYLLWGDMYDYALKMSGEWVNPEDGLTYPVLVEVPVYYPEATEPSEIMSTVTVGGWDDNDPWLGFGEGTLTVTTENISDGQKLITATGIVQNPMAGVAIDITISGKIIPNALENVETTVAPVKVIKNGQLIIIKNGVEYNVQGAVIK